MISSSHLHITNGSALGFQKLWITIKRARADLIIWPTNYANVYGSSARAERRDAWYELGTAYACTPFIHTTRSSAAVHVLAGAAARPAWLAWRTVVYVHGMINAQATPGPSSRPRRKSAEKAAGFYKSLSEFPNIETRCTRTPLQWNPNATFDVEVCFSWAYSP